MSLHGGENTNRSPSTDGHLHGSVKQYKVCPGEDLSGKKTIEYFQAAGQPRLDRENGRNEMLEVTCNGCGAKYKAPEKFAGRKMSCKACSEVMLIGEEAAPEVSSSPVEEEVSQAPVASEEKAPSKKKPSFKKGGISARKGDKKSSFKKGGLSSSKVSRDSDRGSADQAAGSKKSPAMLVVILLLLVGGLAAVDFFVTNMVIGGKAPAGNEEVVAVDDSPEKEPAEEPADEPEAPAEPEETFH